MNRSVSTTQDDAGSPTLADRGTNEKIHSESTEERENIESNSQTLSETPDHQINDSPSKKSVPLETYDSDTSQLEGPSGKSFPNSPDASLSEHGNTTEPPDASASCDPTSVDITLDEKLEALSLDEAVDGATEGPAEDRDSFYSDLLYSGGQNAFPNEALNENLRHESGFRRNFSYNTSGWTPAEIATATGSADRKVMEHPLKLKSAYAEVEVCFIYDATCFCKWLIFNCRRV